MELSWSQLSYVMPLFAVTGNEAFDYFFSLVFSLGAVGWFVSLPMRLFK